MSSEDSRTLELSIVDNEVAKGSCGGTIEVDVDTVIDSSCDAVDVLRWRRKEANATATPETSVLRGSKLSIPRTQTQDRAMKCSDAQNHGVLGVAVSDGGAHRTASDLCGSVTALGSCIPSGEAGRDRHKSAPRYPQTAASLFYFSPHASTLCKRPAHNPAKKSQQIGNCFQRDTDV